MIGVHFDLLVISPPLLDCGVFHAGVSISCLKFTGL